MSAAAGQRITITLEAYNKMKAGLASAERDVKNLERNVKTSSKQITESSRAMGGQFTETGGQMRASMQQSAMGMTMAAGAAYSFYDIYDRIGTAQRIVQQTQVALTAANYGLTRAEARLTKMTEAGTASADEFALAEANVAKYKELHAVTTVRLTEMEGNLQETYVKGAMQVIPSVIMMISGLKMANLTAIPSIHGVSTAMKGLTVTMMANPIMLVAVAAAALVAVLYTVTDGFTKWNGIISGVNTALNYMLLPLQAILDVIGSINPEVKAAADQLRKWREDGIIPLRDETEKAEEELSGFNLTLQDTSDTALMAAPAIEQVSAAVSDMDKRLSKIGDSMFTELIKPSEEYQALLTQLGPWIQEAYDAGDIETAEERVGYLMSATQDLADKMGVDYKVKWEDSWKNFEDYAGDAEKGVEGLDDAVKQVGYSCISATDEIGKLAKAAGEQVKAHTEMYERAMFEKMIQPTDEWQAHLGDAGEKFRAAMEAGDTAGVRAAITQLRLDTDALSKQFGIDFALSIDEAFNLLNNDFDVAIDKVGALKTALNSLAGKEAMMAEARAAGMLEVREGYFVSGYADMEHWERGIRASMESALEAGMTEAAENYAKLLGEGAPSAQGGCYVERGGLVRVHEHEYIGRSGPVITTQPINVTQNIYSEVDTIRAARKVGQAVSDAYHTARGG